MLCVNMMTSCFPPFSQEVADTKNYGAQCRWFNINTTVMIRTVDTAVIVASRIRQIQLQYAFGNCFFLNTFPFMNLRTL